MGFPARREEHSLECYGWTYKNQPPKAMDGPTDVDSLTIGIFACGKNHVLGFGPRARQANPNIRSFKDEWVMTDNFMFADLAAMMGDARAKGPPRVVPRERRNDVWIFDCLGFPHVGEGMHIGKHFNILGRVYDSLEFHPIKQKLIRFVQWIRTRRSSALINDNIF